MAVLSFFPGIKDAVFCEKCNERLANSTFVRYYHDGGSALALHFYCQHCTDEMFDRGVNFGYDLPIGRDDRPGGFWVGWLKTGLDHWGVWPCEDCRDYWPSWVLDKNNDLCPVCAVKHEEKSE